MFHVKHGRGECMARSDKELVRLARLRYDRLKKSNVKNDAIGLLENQLNVFYKGKNKTSKSGISITKSMSVKDRKTMRQILRGFINNPESQISRIINTFQKIFSKYIETLSPKMQEKAKKEKMSVVDMQTLTTKYKRAITDKELMAHYGSQVMRDVVDNQKSTGISFDVYRQVMINGMNNNSENFIEMEDRSSFDVLADILNEVGDMIDNEI